MSASAKHTPGPWTYDAPSLYRPEEKHFFGVGPSGTIFIGAWKAAATVADQREAVEANARLIAAAPEMLIALQMVRRFAVPLTDGTADSVHAVVTLALAKAEGGTS